MSSVQPRYDRTVICPGCGKPTIPNIIEQVAAVPSANPPIPARLVLQCKRGLPNTGKSCDHIWYVKDEDDTHR